MKSIKRLWNYFLLCICVKETCKNVNRPAIFCLRSITKTTKLDLFWLRFYSNKINIKRLFNNSKRCLKINLINIQCWPSLSTFSEETINLHRQNSTYKMPKTRPATPMMLVCVSVVVFIINMQEIQLRL